MRAKSVQLRLGLAFQPLEILRFGKIRILLAAALCAAREQNLALARTTQQGGQKYQPRQPHTSCVLAPAVPHGVTELYNTAHARGMNQHDLSRGID